MMARECERREGEEKEINPTRVSRAAVLTYCEPSRLLRPVRRRALLSSRVVCLCDRVSSCVMPPCVAVSLVSVKRLVLRVLC